MRIMDGECWGINTLFGLVLAVTITVGSENCLMSLKFVKTINCISCCNRKYSNTFF